MGGVKNLLIEYCEITGKSQDEAASVPLAEMQRIVASRQITRLPMLPVLDLTMPDPDLWTLKQMPTGIGKTGCSPRVQPPVPWITISTYVNVGLKAVGLQDYTSAVVAENGLHVIWEDYRIEINTLLNQNPSRQHPPVFQVKLFKHDYAQPLAAGFNQEYTGVTCLCAEFLNNVLIRRALTNMEIEWATESAAADSDAEALFERDEAIAEEQSQLDNEETEAEALFERGEAIAEELAQLDHLDHLHPFG